MDTFNLDIDAYRDSELVDIFGLTPPCSYEDVAGAKDALVKQLKVNSDIGPERKKDIMLFMDSIANRINNMSSKSYKFSHRPRQKPLEKSQDGTWAEKKVPIAQYGSNVIIKNQNEIVGKHAKITEGRIAMSSDVPPGYINP